MEEIIQLHKARQYVHNKIKKTSSSVLPLHSTTNKVVRKLTWNEIEILKDNQNTCSCSSSVSVNFENIFILHETTSSTNINKHENECESNNSTELAVQDYFKNHVRYNHFSQTIIFVVCPSSLSEKGSLLDNNNYTGSSSSGLKMGLYNNRLLEDCIFHINSTIYNNTMIQNTYIGPNVEIIDCCRIMIRGKEKNWKDEMDITVGAESGGGRVVTVCPESTLLHICSDLGFYDGSGTSITKCPSFDNSIEWNVFEKDCSIIKCSALDRIHCSAHCTIECCDEVTNVILLDHSTLQSCSTVQNVYLQWNAGIISSHVTQTLLMEQSHIGPNSTINSSIIGPDSGLSCGEVHNSVLGSNFVSHHQSLCISIIAPSGRINVGYGSNIGSNHTSRSPDQEIFVGEGIFFGLDCSIKFPVNLISCPYSIIATSVQLPSYFHLKNMPFSLILKDSKIIPAWVIQHSPYTIERNETKYQTRFKATRHRFYLAYSIYRKDIVQLCVLARNRLLQQTLSSDDDILLNSMSQKAKSTGIKGYTEFIRRFALHGLYQHVQQLYISWKSTTSNYRNDTINTVKLIPPPINASTTIQQHFQHIIQSSSLSTTPNINNNDILHLPFANNNKQDATTTSTTTYQIQLLFQEYNEHPTATISSLLQEFIIMQKRYAHRVFQSKQKDETRGKNVIPYYELGHDIVEEKDAVIQNVNTKVKEQKELVEKVCKDWFFCDVDNGGDDVILKSRL